MSACVDARATLAVTFCTGGRVSRAVAAGGAAPTVPFTSRAAVVRCNAAHRPAPWSPGQINPAGL